MNSGELKEIVQRSQHLVAQGRHADDLALLREAVGNYPDEVEIVLRAAFASVVDAPTEAVRLARRAGSLAPENPSGLMRSSSLLLDLGYLDEARDHCEQAIEAADDDFPAVYDLCYLAGRIAVADGDPEAAERYLAVPFGERPDIERYGLELGFLLESQHRWEEALVVVERALEHHPEDQELEALAIRSRVNLYGLDALPPGATLEPE